MAFLDEVTITVRGGDGGHGASSFRREAHVPRGGPDGGDGGRGGSVYLRVDSGETMLRDYRYKHHFRGESGGSGSGSRKHGKAGKDLDLNVPPGTVVRDLETNDLIADLVSREQRVMIARGGRGGLGNTHFATSTNQAPTHAQKGEPGEERKLKLELRLIADVGLVGLPNAGKSTTLSALTAATPQVAPYPFTTLEPNLGVLELEDERRVTIADMPGLIEGASAGAGLGHAFLRHVSRNRVLAHVVDLSTVDPERDYQVIREELEAHDASLLSKVTLVIGNKIDLDEATAAAKAFAKSRRRDGIEFVAVSAALGEGVDELLEALGRLLPDAETLAEPGEPAGVVIHRFENAPDMFTVSREGDAYRVMGRRIERLAAQTDFENEESAERFQRDLARSGIERELVRAGVGQGDTVRIGQVELEWDPD
ncbi:MAG TPA: GTPase ObgE [Candidatus Limnocylindrales bacterium]|nr:GTPase ObgE [Candidatus Limnocylindrales bacterium]